MLTGRATSGATTTERPKGIPQSQGLGGSYSQTSVGPQCHRSSAQPKGWGRTQSKTLARDVTKTFSDQVDKRHHLGDKGHQGATQEHMDLCCLGQQQGGNLSLNYLNFSKSELPKKIASIIKLVVIS